jgi:hypothetical protein
MGNRELRFVTVRRSEIPADEYNGNSYTSLLLTALAKAVGKDQAIAVDVGTTKEAGYLLQRINAHTKKHGAPFVGQLFYQRSSDKKTLYLWVDDEEKLDTAVLDD